MPLQHEPLHILQQFWGYASFRPLQEDIIRSVLAGRDTLALLPTGGGKSICYQVPAMCRKGICLVVSPLIALMKDQVHNLQKRGIPSAAIFSGMSRREIDIVFENACNGAYKLLYLSPERLKTDLALARIQRMNVNLLAVDEAHCVSQWGYDFRPPYLQIADLRTLLPNVPILALTATATSEVLKDIREKLAFREKNVFRQSFVRANLSYSVLYESKKREKLLDILRNVPGTGIVYARSRGETKEIARLLTDNRLSADFYHAGLTPEERNARQEAWIAGKTRIIVCTNAFGMGIDKPDVRFVFHADLPSSLEAYYQEFGRAGRDGKPAEAHMLFGLADIRMRRMFIDEEDSDADRKRREHQRLGSLLGFCEASGCRRQILLRYFGERAEPCGNCDACTAPVAMIDATDDARLALGAVQATGGRYGAGHIVDLLVGTFTDKIARARHDALDAFNKGTHRKREEWQSLIRQLVAGDHLTVDVQGYGGLSMTPKGRALRAGKDTFSFRPPGKPKRAERQAREAAAIATGDVDASLLATLKQLRLSLAKQRGVAAYLIFSDKSLIDMAERRPKNVDEFGEVHGVGAAKQKEFAKTFLEAIAAHEEH